MNKKLLVAAVGAALTAGPMMAVFADVKIGGHAQVEVASEDTEGGAAGDSDRNTFEDNSRGRFWITANEDLGGGLKGLAHYEFKLDTTGENPVDAAANKTGALTATNVREKWVGLQGGFGTLKFGSVRSPYKYAGGVTWDAFVTTNLEARNNGGMLGGVFGHNNFYDNSINYQSPNFGGLTFGATYSIDEAPGTFSTAEDGDLAAAVEWKGGGLHLIGAIASDDGEFGGGTPAGTAGADTDNTKLGARYDFGNFSVMGQLENSDVDGGAETDVLFLGLQAKMGNWLWALQFGNTDVDGGAETDYLALGGFFNFSKTFSAFGGFRNTEVENGAETDVLTFGLRKIF